MNCGGEPLLTRQVIVNLIAATTRTGLKVYARLDPGSYPKAIKINKQPSCSSTLTCKPTSSTPKWNYAIPPINNER